MLYISQLSWINPYHVVLFLVILLFIAPIIQMHIDKQVEKEVKIRMKALKKKNLN